MERDALRIEVERLGDVNITLLTEQSAQEERVADLEQKVLDLVPLRSEPDVLAERNKSNEVALANLLAERNTLERRFDCEATKVLETTAERERLREQLAQTEANLALALDKDEHTNRQLELRNTDLASLIADLARLSGEQHTALQAIERLSMTVADRDRTICNLRRQLNGEMDRSRQSLARAEAMLRGERERLSSELRMTCAGEDRLFQDHESAEVEYWERQSTNAEPNVSHEQLATNTQLGLETERSLQLKLVEEIAQLRANAEETDELIEALASLTMSSPNPQPSLVEELDAAHIQCEKLKHQLDNSERVDRMTSDSRASVGIHQTWPKPRIGARPSN